MQTAHTHSYMSVLAHKLTYRWYPWGNFNPFQTVCLHQRTWYHLWDQASSKWFRMSKFSWRIQCTSIFHCFPAWFQDGSHQGTSKTCTSSSLILCNGLQVYPFAWMILRCGLWCGYKLWARNVLWTCMFFHVKLSIVAWIPCPSILSKKYIVSPTEIWQVFIHSVHR